MKKLNITVLLIVIAVLVIGFTSCGKWVDKVDPLIANIEDEDLLTEENIDFLVGGLLEKLGDFGNGSIISTLHQVTGFCDDFAYDRNAPGDPSVDAPSVSQDLPMDISFVEGEWAGMHEVRWYAEDLINKIAQIEASGGISDQAKKEDALWWAYLIGGMARMYLGEWFCLDKNSGPGAVITTIEMFEAGEFGSFQTMAEIHEDARAFFTNALNYEPYPIEGIGAGCHDQIVHSFMARTYLFDGNYAQAKAEAEQGLQMGDPPFEALRDYRYFNQWWCSGGGRGPGWALWRGPWIAHPRWIQYVLDDRKEGEVITDMTEADDPYGLTQSLRGYEGAVGEPGHTLTENPRADIANPNERIPLHERGIRRDANGFTEVIYFQDIFENRTDNVPFIDWREMELILAEVAIRGGDLGTGATHINNVRTYHGLDAITVDDLNAYDNPKGGASTEYWPGEFDRTATVNSHTGALGFLIEERDKTLWMKGTRIQDQWRFDLWHMEPDTWHFIPIPYTERDLNPNVPTL
jgi:tetratricopeptide (TPR) repeat protein